MTGKVEPIGLWHGDFTDYPLLYTRTGKAESIGLWQWEFTDYTLLYTITGKDEPLEYDTEILQTTFFTIVWQVSSSSLDYDTERVQTISIYTKTVKAEPVGLCHWDSTDNPLFYTIIVKAKPFGLWHWDFTAYPLLFLVTCNSMPVELWNWDSTDYTLSTRWQERPRLLNYDTETLQTTIYLHDDR